MTYSWRDKSNKQQQIFNTRVIASMVIICLALSVLLIRLAILQIVQHEKYITLSRENQIRVIPVAPPRGLIYDRNGVVLADNVPAFDLVVVPERIEHHQALFEQLKKLINLTEEEIEKTQKKIKLARPFDRVPVRLQLNEEDQAKLALNRHLLPSVEVTATLIRHYPHKHVFAHAIGYVGQIDEHELKKVNTLNYKGTNYYGKAGVERFYEDALHGEVGYQEVETDARGRTLRNLNFTPPVPGKPIILGLDIRLQNKAAEVLADKYGSVVGLDPTNGEVLVMYSSPSFDPNLFVMGMSNKTYQELRTGPGTPLFNRAVQGKYPPASTVKPFISLVALYNEVITPSFTISDPGFYQLGGAGRRYRDWRPHGHGVVNLHKAVQQSCDTYFYTVAHKLGIHALSNGLKAFGFGQKTGLDLVEEAKGVLPSDEWKRRTFNQVWFPGETLSMGIGQGYLLVTPVQMAASTSLMANKGHQYQLRLVKQIGDEEVEAELLKNYDITVSDAQWEFVHKAMVSVVSEPGGTAFYLNQGLKYPMAGKTGTAQVVGISEGAKYVEKDMAHHLRDHTWFVTFAPVDDPNIALAIIVENEHGSPKLAREIMDVRYETTLSVTEH